MPYRNKEDKLANDARYREANRNKVNAATYAAHAANPEKYAATHKAWKRDNPKKVKAIDAAYRERNREELNRKNREYQKDNPDVINAKTHRRRAAKTKAGGAYTSAQWMALCNKYGNVCLCCEKFAPLTPDHIVPIVKGGTSNIDNIQPLCMPCNAKKHTATTDFRIKFDLNTTKP